MKELAILITLLFVSQLVMANGNSEKGNIDFSKEWNGDKIISIDVDLATASLKLIPTDKEVVVLNIYGRAPFNDVEDFIEYDVRNGKLVVKRTNKLRLTLFQRYNINVDIYIPKKDYEDIVLHTSTGAVGVSGELICENFEGSFTTGRIGIDELVAEKITIKSSTGSQTLGKLSGNDIILKSSTGRINAGELNGKNIKVSSSTGNIDIENIIGDLTASLTTGRIDVEYREYESEDIKISTTTGNIRLKLPVDSSFKLNSSTVTGRIESSFPITVAGKVKKNRLVGEVNGGRGDISLQNTTGNIDIR